MKALVIDHIGNSYWVYPPADNDGYHWDIVPCNPVVDKPTGKLHKAIKNKAKALLGINGMKMSEISLDYNTVTWTVSPVEPVCTAAVTYDASVMEKNMYDCDDDCCTPKSDTARAKSYLAERLFEEQDQKVHEARKHFGLADDNAPADIGEFVKRIQDGKFVVPEKYKEKNWYYANEFIRWRDPAKVEDNDGMTAARKMIEDAATETRDTIKVLPETDGLAALRAFKAKTFH